MRTLQSKHPDETDSEPEPLPDPTPFNGPLGSVFKPPPTKWKLAKVPDYVTRGTRIQDPLTLDDIIEGGRNIEIAGSDKITLIEQKKLMKLLPCDGRWAFAVIGGFKPCSRHSFRIQVGCRRAVSVVSLFLVSILHRLQCRNAFGRSKFGESSDEQALPPDVPVKPMAPYPAASSFSVALLYWIEPCHNGIETSEYHVQLRRVYTDGSEDSESDEGENDTPNWRDGITAAVSDCIGSHRLTGTPDLVKLCALRGKRRNGRRCSIPVANLRAGKTYQFRLRALNDIGWSEFSEASIVCRTIACEPDAPRAPVVTQHLPRMLRVSWNPPRSNGARITRVLLHRQEVSQNWRIELHDHDLDAPNSTLNEPQADGEVTETAEDLEGMALRMHPDSVTVLQRLKREDGWSPVLLSPSVELGQNKIPKPTNPAEIQALPVGPDGGTLLSNRPYVDIVVDNLKPESFHRFRIRFSNSRGFSKWSKPSVPCEVYADWPDSIEKPPVAVARSPFSLFLTWLEPEVSLRPRFGEPSFLVALMRHLL